MNPDDQAIEAMVEVLAPMLGLTIEPDMRPHVVTHLAIAARMAALLDDFPLDPREEPAPVFTPGAAR